jgi:preprotein translocase subunit SecG
LIFVILIQAGDKGGGLSSLDRPARGCRTPWAPPAPKDDDKLTTISACLFIILAIACRMSSATSAEGKNILPDARLRPAR